MADTSKHTPGPWSVYVHDDHTECPGIESDVVSIVVFDQELAGGNQAGVQGRTVAECRANARLIAAAPDLLAALVACLEIMRQSEPWDRAKAADHYEIARAAIARAEG
jgi:hypothetical protein